MILKPTLQGRQYYVLIHKETDAEKLSDLSKVTQQRKMYQKIKRSTITWRLFIQGSVSALNEDIIHLGQLFVPLTGRKNPSVLSGIFTVTELREVSVLLICLF